MKKIIFALTVCVCVFTTSYSQITVNTDGTVETGTSLSVGSSLEVGFNLNVTNRTTTEDLKVNDQAHFYNGFSTVFGTADVNGLLDATNITSPNDILSDKGFKCSRTDYYTMFMHMDIMSNSLYADILGISSPTGYLGTSSHPWYQTHTKYLYVNGSAVTSDRRAKENIRDLKVQPISLINKLVPVKFDYIQEVDSKDENLKEIYGDSEKLRKNKVGFIAQDVEVIFPEAVIYDSISDKYYIDYNAFTPLLVKAVQEQQLVIESLQSQLNTINALMVKESNLKSISTSIGENLTSKIVLYQNSQNPFSQETKIAFSLPSDISDVRLLIHDMTGKQLKSYEIHDRGESFITIYSGELEAGMFMYSLIVDGNICDTKQMIITK